MKTNKDKICDECGLVHLEKEGIIKQKYVITIEVQQNNDIDFSDTITEFLQDLNCMTYQVDKETENDTKRKKN